MATRVPTWTGVLILVAIAVGILLIPTSSKSSSGASLEGSALSQSEFRIIARQRFQAFVVASTEAMRNRSRVQEFARRTCAGLNVCFVHFWTNERLAGRSIPMTDAQVNSMVASYNINRNTGNDAFQCYNFGTPGERCA